MTILADVIVKGTIGKHLANANYEFYVLPQKGDYIVLNDENLYIVLDIIHIPYGMKESAGITISVVSS